jgi:hypothetical protein
MRLGRACDFWPFYDLYLILMRLNDWRRGAQQRLIFARRKDPYCTCVEVPTGNSQSLYTYCLMSKKKDQVIYCHSRLKKKCLFFKRFIKTQNSIYINVFFVSVYQSRTMNL